MHRLTCVRIALLACAAALACQVAATSADEPDLDAKATDIIQQAGDYLRDLKTFQCKCASAMKLTGPGMSTDMTSSYTIAVERPKKVAVRLIEGMIGSTLVCDGNKSYMHMPAMRKYVVDDSPDEIGELFEGETSFLFMQGATMFLPPLFSADPGKTLLEGVTSGKYVGEEEIDGVACHRLTFTQPEMKWDIWIESSDKPLIRKIVPDMAKAMAAAAAMLKDMKIETALTFSDWQVNGELPAEMFAFDAPSDAEQTESFFGDLLNSSAEPELHQLVGKPAPDFESELLDGGAVKFSELKDKVAILDFWATWCPPCVEGLPIVAKVASEYADRGVEFFAVNVSEEPETIREFLAQHKLEIDVALDPEGKTSELFGVSGIPQTVLVGKDGTVQVVHVGLSGDLDERLRNDLDALLAGENLAEKAIREAEERKQTAAAENEGVELAWSVDGAWSGVVALEGSAIVVATGGKALEIDADGKQLREFQLGGGARSLRAATFEPGAKSALVGFDHWGPSVAAYTLAGEQLWSYDHGQGVDDVWTADLDGDRVDEVLVGYNGATGLHAVDAKGAARWKHTGIGNVWHVTAGDLTGDDQPEVITTSARGVVHVFDAQGQPLDEMDPDIYGSMVRYAPESAALDGARVLVAGRSEEEGSLVCLDTSRKRLWTTPLAGQHVNSAAVASSKPWIALSAQSSKIEVVDLVDGKVIARVAGQGTVPEIAWLERSNATPVLLVTTGAALNAYVLTEPK